MYKLHLGLFGVVFRVIAHLAAKPHERQGFHEVQNLVQFGRGVADNFLFGVGQMKLPHRFLAEITGFLGNPAGHGRAPAPRPEFGLGAGLDGRFPQFLKGNILDIGAVQPPL